MTLIRYRFLLLASVFLTLNACGKLPISGSSDEEDSGAGMDGSNIATLVNTSGDLPECSEANNGRLYYIKATKEFRLCQDAEFVVLDIKGDEGNAAPSGAWVLDADGQPIGAVLRIDTTISIVMENGGTFNVFVPRGTHAGAPKMENLGYSLSHGAHCSFTTTDCTGTCYQRSGVIDASIDPTRTLSPAGNAVYEQSQGVFVRATGLEMTTDVVLRSAWRHDDGGSGNPDTYAALTCKSVAQLEVGNTFSGQAITEYRGPAYPITSSFEFPAGVHYPFKTPLSIGVSH